MTRLARQYRIAAAASAVADNITLRSGGAAVTPPVPEPSSRVRRGTRNLAGGSVGERPNEAAGSPQDRLRHTPTTKQAGCIGLPAGSSRPAVPQVGINQAEAAKGVEVISGRMRSATPAKWCDSRERPAIVCAGGGESAPRGRVQHVAVLQTSASRTTERCCDTELAHEPVTKPARQQPAPSKRALEHLISEAGAELGAALMMALPSDNEIIIEHIRAAHDGILAASRLLRALGDDDAA